MNSWAWRFYRADRLKHISECKHSLHVSSRANCYYPNPRFLKILMNKWTGIWWAITSILTRLLNELARTNRWVLTVIICNLIIVLCTWKIIIYLDSDKGMNYKRRWNIAWIVIRSVICLECNGPFRENWRFVSISKVSRSKLSNSRKIHAQNF